MEANVGFCKEKVAIYFGQGQLAIAFAVEEVEHARASCSTFCIERVGLPGWSVAAAVAALQAQARIHCCPAQAGTVEGWGLDSHV